MVTKAGAALQTGCVSEESQEVISLRLSARRRVRVRGESNGREERRAERDLADRDPPERAAHRLREEGVPPEAQGEVAAEPVVPRVPEEQADFLPTPAMAMHVFQP